MSSIKKNIAGINTIAKKGVKVGIVRSEYNSQIVDSMYAKCLDTLLGAKVSGKNIKMIKVPGAFELPFACQKLANTKKFDVIIALGALIEGGTPHFDYIASSCAQGIMDVSLKTGTPVVFGVLTTNTMAQAKARIDKGVEVAVAAIEITKLNL